MPEHQPSTGKSDHSQQGTPSLCALGTAQPTLGERSGFPGQGSPSGGDGHRVTTDPRSLERGSKVRWAQLIPGPLSPLRGQGPDAPHCEGETKALKKEQKLCQGHRTCPRKDWKKPDLAYGMRETTAFIECVFYMHGLP